MQPASFLVAQSTPAASAGEAAGGCYDIHFDSRPFPAGWKDAAVFCAALYSWILVSVMAAIAAPALLISTLPSALSFIGGFVPELGRFAEDAFSEWLGVALVLILGHWVWWWSRGISHVETGASGMRLTRRMGRTVSLQWGEILQIDRKTFAANSLSVLNNYRITGAHGNWRYAPADALAFETALARLRPAVAPAAPLTWTRRLKNIARTVLRMLLVFLCVGVLVTVLLISIKFVADPANTGSAYLSGPLQRLFLLKPSAAAPAAQSELLVNGVKSGAPAVVREVIGRAGNLREMEANLVQIAIWGRKTPASANNMSAVSYYSVGEVERRVEIMQMLIAHGAHIDPGALLDAAFSNERLFETLRAAGAPLDDVGDGGMPDVAAAARESLAALTLYLDAKADANQADNSGNTPLMIVAQSSKPYEHKRRAMDLLAARGARADVQNSRGATLAHALARGGDVKLFGEWIARAGGYEARTANGETLMHAAAAGEKTELIQQLINSSGSVNVTMHGGATPLHHARKPAVIEFLVAKGADVNAPDSSGRTPLHAAVIERRWDAAPALIKSGARKYARDKSEAGGKTALDYFNDQLGGTGKPPRNRDELIKLLTP